MTDFDNAVYDLLKSMQEEREKAGKHPTHVLYLEVVRALRDSLNTLKVKGKIQVGDTANDKYIRVIK